jgi:hypothetical protein
VIRLTAGSSRVCGADIARQRTRVEVLECREAWSAQTCRASRRCVYAGPTHIEAVFAGLHSFCACSTSDVTA